MQIRMKDYGYDKLLISGINNRSIRTNSISELIIIDLPFFDRKDGSGKNSSRMHPVTVASIIMGISNK